MENRPDWAKATDGTAPVCALISTSPIHRWLPRAAAAFLRISPRLSQQPNGKIPPGADSCVSGTRRCRTGNGYFNGNPPELRRWPISARLLLALSRDPKADDYPGGTERHVADHTALEFVLETVPSFLEMIRGKRVLDYGCGMGDQALAMKSAGAASVVGYDPHPKADQALPGVTFTAELPREVFDVVLSCSAFEHFAEPERELKNMCELTGSRLVVTWAEPWYSHSGSHMNFFTRVPWVNLLFPERSVMFA